MDNLTVDLQYVGIERVGSERNLVGDALRISKTKPRSCKT